MAKNYDKELLLADYRVGRYTQRALADKYGVSVSMVSKLTISAEKDLQDLVNKRVQAQRYLEGKSEQEINAIENAVAFQLDLLKDIKLFSNKAISKASDLIDSAETGSDFKSIVEGVDRLSILNKINDRHASPKKIEEEKHSNKHVQVTFLRATGPKDLIG